MSNAIRASALSGDSLDMAITASMSKSLTPTQNNRYAVCALEKDSAGFGDLFFRGGRPPSKRFFYVRNMAVSMSVPCGRPSGLPVPLIRFANLHGIAHPVWRRESDEGKHIRGVSHD